MKKRVMRPGTMLNPVPAVLVSCRDKEKNNLITIAWTGIVNSEPPMTYISVRKSRFSHEMIKNSGEFVINMVSEELTPKLDLCGVKSGRDIDKFSECGFKPVKGEIVSAPMVDEAVVNLECIVKDVIEYPSHDMFVAEIVKVHDFEYQFFGNAEAQFVEGFQGYFDDPLTVFLFHAYYASTLQMLAQQHAQKY